jgi:hypothetical protein
MNIILPLDESYKIKGEIYRIINTKENKMYIGQTRTHRKNKNKYRFFGYISRFNDHISEAINNTKKKQCTYLNNSIRINKDCFIVELIETCEVNVLDEREIYYIKKYNTLHTNGYNLTEGGKTVKYIKIESNEELQTTKKRGRPFHYVHSEETKEKMKTSLKNVQEHMKNIASTIENKNRVSATIKKYYDEQKINRARFI